MWWIRNIYLPKRFFTVFIVNIALFLSSYVLDFLFPVAQALIVFLLAVVCIDYILIVTQRKKIRASRKTSSILSLGDENKVTLKVFNHSPIRLNARIIDELPVQLQRRDFSKQLSLKANDFEEFSYFITPKERGDFQFGNTQVFIETLLGLIALKLESKTQQSVKTYPSIIQMKNLELLAFSAMTVSYGVKKIRRIGHSYEFEQIKNYVFGDDTRSINWKASSRRGEIMVNQYEDEKSQQIYCLIDKSRNMRMPFNGLSLIDYAINATLAISNIALKKQDKAGMISFAEKIDTVIPSARSFRHLSKIMEALYNEKFNDTEADYQKVFHASRNVIHGRSLILLFTNFESKYALERNLPILRKLSRQHLLVVLFFENTEIEEYSQKPVETVLDIYQQTMARKFIQEKDQIIKELSKHGIQAVKSKPQDLALNTVNKYLELKSRGLI
ncbi:MAG: DUF58 domain-containing protein [Flavobacteriales bacterium]|nr:DUF58 domain-containing protein [Flavobacteriales bacterium]